MKQIRTNHKKSEQIGTSLGVAENKERKSEENGEIGTNRGDPLLLIGGSDKERPTIIDLSQAEIASKLC